jgi:hypothetical protein
VQASVSVEHKEVAKQEASHWQVISPGSLHCGLTQAKYAWKSDRAAIVPRFPQAVTQAAVVQDEAQIRI